MMRRRASSRAASSLRRSALPGTELVVPGEAGVVDDGELSSAVTGADGGGEEIGAETAFGETDFFSFFALDRGALFAEGEVFRVFVVAFDPNTDSLLGAALRAEVDDPFVAPADRRLAGEVVREVRSEERRVGKECRSR